MISSGSLINRQQGITSSTVVTSIGRSDIGRIAESALAEGIVQIENEFGKYGAKAPKPITLVYISAEKARSIGMESSELARVDPARPNEIVINVDHSAFKTANVKHIKHLILHELTHIYSMDFGRRSFAKYGGYIGQSEFKDGTLLSKVLMEGLPEYFTLSLTGATSPLAYKGELAWARLLVQKLGVDTVKRGFFGMDPSALKQIDQVLGGFYSREQLDSGGYAARRKPRQRTSVSEEDTSRLIAEAKAGRDYIFITPVKKKLVELFGVGADRLITECDSAEEFEKIKSAFQAVVTEQSRIQINAK
jgi:hypothetical protein